MLQRKIIQAIETWYKSGSKKALLLCGARQVGKTTAIREFAKTHYTHFVEVNFVKYPTAKIAFDGDLTTSQIIANLSAMGFGPFVMGHTLLFLDEIQECPNARTAIKFLVEDQQLDIIESGSLLGINYKPIPSYPVGFEQQVNVYPLDFEEFLWAKGINNEVIDILRNACYQLTPVPAFIHQQISKLYREYLIVGGMPEVVQTYIDNPDFSHTIKQQQSILTTYRADITHYAGKQAPLVKRIFDAIPAELGKQDKRFVLADIEKGASLRKYEDPTQWLVDAGLAYYSFNTSALELPFESTENRKLYKLYLVDTGLLCGLLLKNMQFAVLNGDIGINEGALTENFIACTLAAKDIPLHYFDRKSKHELDFVLPEQNNITILEVKSGHDYKQHASLDKAMNDFNNHINRAIVFCADNISQENGILYCPLYLSEFLL